MKCIFFRHAGSSAPAHDAKAPSGGTPPTLSGPVLYAPEDLYAMAKTALAWWQPRLRLADWQIDVVMVKRADMEDKGLIMSVTPLANQKRARVCVVEDADYGGLFNDSVMRVMCHELLHLMEHEVGLWLGLESVEVTLRRVLPTPEADNLVLLIFRGYYEDFVERLATAQWEAYGKPGLKKHKKGYKVVAGELR